MYTDVPWGSLACASKLLTASAPIPVAADPSVGSSGSFLVVESGAEQGGEASSDLAVGGSSTARVGAKH